VSPVLHFALLALMPAGLAVAIVVDDLRWRAVALLLFLAGAVYFAAAGLAD